MLKRDDVEIAKEIVTSLCDRDTTVCRYVPSAKVFYVLERAQKREEWLETDKPTTIVVDALDVILEQLGRQADLPEDQRKRLRKHIRDTRRNAARRRETISLVREYAKVTPGMHSDLMLSYLAKQTKYDPLRNLVEIATCKPRALEPKRSKAVERWLINLCGGVNYGHDGHDATQYELLRDWLACAPRLEKSIPGLYLHGRKQMGKSALVHGLSRIWTTEGPAKALNAFKRFNDALVSCPVILADEGFPLDENRRPATKRFREMVEDRFHSIERKYKDIAKLEGCVRIVACENGSDMFKFRGDEMTRDDIKAIGSRILHIACGKNDHERGFKRVAVTPEAGELLASDAFARHVLWLAENHPVVPGDRMLCRANGEKLVSAIANSDGIRGAVLTHVCEVLHRGTSSETGVKLHAGDICVNAHQIARHERTKAAGEYSAFTARPNEAVLLGAIKSLETGKQPRLGARGARVRYTVIDRSAVLRHARDLGLTLEI